MLTVLSFIRVDPESPFIRQFLRSCFEFAFKVEQLIHNSDDEATELLERVFEQLENVHQNTMQQLRDPSPAKQRQGPAIRARMGSDLPPIAE